nr:L506 [uncultured bacterium]
MNDSGRVCTCQSSANLNADVQDFTNREVTLIGQFPDGFAVDELGGNEMGPIHFPDLMNGEDIRMIQGGRSPRLGLETPKQRCVRDQ